MRRSTRLSLSLSLSLFERLLEEDVEELHRSRKELRAFLEGSAGTLERKDPLMEYFNVTSHLEMAIDVSPWGLGGGLTSHGRPIEWFSSRLDENDERVHRASVGGAAGQQTWESLCALVALRLWAGHWRGKRVALRVRGDSVAMLSLLLHLRPFHVERLNGAHRP